jgi:hypothetical protein
MGISAFNKQPFEPSSPCPRSRSGGHLWHRDRCMFCDESVPGRRTGAQLAVDLAFALVTAALCGGAVLGIGYVLGVFP